MISWVFVAVVVHGQSGTSNVA